MVWLISAQLGQYLLTGVGGAASTSSVSVAVGVADVVAVFFVAGVVSDELEALAPED